MTEINKMHDPPPASFDKDILSFERHNHSISDYNRNVLDLFDLSKNHALMSHLHKLQKIFRARAEYRIGYPTTYFNYSAFGNFLNVVINNLGDPTTGGLDQIHAKEYELKVLRFYYNLYRCHQNAWGYLTSGSTEANKMAFLLTRQLYGNRGVVFFSDQTHSFVVDRSKDYFNKHIVIPSQKNGELNYEIFEERLKRLHKHGDYIPVVVANIGTTFLGAIDNIAFISEILKESKIENFYLHCDAALFGNIIPFQGGGSLLDFEKYPIDSISVSGHKFPGIPIPCGLFICRHAKLFNEYKETAYLEVKNSTLSCSRSGLAALMWWAFIEHLGQNGLQAMVQHCDKMTKYVMQRFQDIEWEAWVNKNSNTVVFKAPYQEIIKKWVLATEGAWAHLIAMPYFSYSLVDKFIMDFKRYELIYAKRKGVKST